MKRISLSWLHFLVATLTFIFCQRLFGQSMEIVPYRLTPSGDAYCQISVELVEPTTFLSIPDIYKEEIYEILVERVVFEETNPFSINEPFRIDDKMYQLVKLPNTGEKWYMGTWNHSE